jgi:type II secretory pathway pseudopilin PulG
VRRGSTLVETVVAIALLGVGISACVACIGGATRASAKAEEYTAVQLLAQEKLAELRLRGSASPGRGDFGPERPGYTWETEVEEQQGLRQVRLTLHWGDEERPQSAEFLTAVRGTINAQAGTATNCSKCHPGGMPGSRSRGGSVSPTRAEGGR